MGRKKKVVPKVSPEVPKPEEPKVEQPKDQVAAAN